MKILSLLLAVSALAFTGCSTVNPATTQLNSKLSSMKSAYVITHGGTSADMDLHLQEALVKRGLTVKAGPEESKAADVDFYASYTDTWRWDLTMYLKELHIAFYDAKSGALLASGSFNNSFLHSFPNPADKVRDVIATMYGERPQE
jgi:hypothetical protein